MKTGDMLAHYDVSRRGLCNAQIDSCVHWEDKRRSRACYYGYCFPLERVHIWSFDVVFWFVWYGIISDGSEYLNLMFMHNNIKRTRTLAEQPLQRTSALTYF